MIKYWANQEIYHAKNIRYSDALNRNFVCSLENWRAGRWWTVLTSSVMHISLFHLGANMFALYSLGPLFTSVFGVRGFLLTWVTSAVLCGRLSLWWDSKGRKMTGLTTGNTIPGGTTMGGSVGASGAIAGMVTALMCAAPRLPIQIFPIPINMPLWIANTIFAVFSGYCMVEGQFPFLGHAGHLGGMTAGIVTYYAALRPWLRRLRL